MYGSDHGECAPASALGLAERVIPRERGGVRLARRSLRASKPADAAGTCNQLAGEPSWSS